MQTCNNRKQKNRNSENAQVQHGLEDSITAFSLADVFCTDPEDVDFSLHPPGCRHQVREREREEVSWIRLCERPLPILRTHTHTGFLHTHLSMSRVVKHVAGGRNESHRSAHTDH